MLGELHERQIFFFLVTFQIKKIPMVLQNLVCSQFKTGEKHFEIF